MTRERVKKLLPILQAYAEGKEIQWFDSAWGIWRETNDCCSFSDEEKYRIKPITADDLKENKNISHKLRDTVQESLKELNRYRPFKDCDELIDTWIKKLESKTEYRFGNPLQKPYIWVKSIEYGTENCITAFDNNEEHICESCVFIQDMWVDMNELFDHFTFLDNSACGVEE